MTLELFIKCLIIKTCTFGWESQPEISESERHREGKSEQEAGRLFLATSLSVLHTHRHIYISLNTHIYIYVKKTRPLQHLFKSTVHVHTCCMDAHSHINCSSKNKKRKERKNKYIKKHHTASREEKRKRSH